MSIVFIIPCSMPLNLPYQWELRYFGQSVYTFRSQFGPEPYVRSIVRNNTIIYWTYFFNNYICIQDTEIKGDTTPASYTLYRVEGTADQYKYTNSIFCVIYVCLNETTCRIVDTSDHEKGWTLTSSDPSTNVRPPFLPYLSLLSLTRALINVDRSLSVPIMEKLINTGSSLRSTDQMPLPASDVQLFFADTMF